MHPHPDPSDEPSDEPHILDGKLEPELKHSTDDRAVFYSMAISLKRIADALTGSDQNQGMAASLFYIEQRLGQMGHG